MRWTTLEYSHIVKVRVPHQCLGCHRKWPAGSKMITWVSCETSYGPARSYFCTICEAYWAEHYTEFDDGELPEEGLPVVDPQGYMEIESQLEHQLPVIEAGLEFIGKRRKDEYYQRIEFWKQQARRSSGG